MATSGEFVDRIPELALLSDEYTRTREDQPRIVLVGGEAGIGKTALVERFRDRVDPEGTRTHIGRTAVAIGGQLPYAPLMELVDDILRKNAELLATLGPALVDLGPLLNAAHRRAVEPAPDPVFAKTRMLEGLRALVEGVGLQRSPIICVLEDLQWADDGSLDAFAYLVRQLRAAPVLLIATYRPTGLDLRPQMEALLVELIRHDHVTHIALGPIPDSDLIDLAARKVDSKAAGRLVARAAGNPYFLGEIVAASATGAALPPDLADFLLLRVKALPPAARVVAQVVAVCGEDASERLVEAVLGVPPHEVVAAFGALVRSQVLRRPTGTQESYRFATPLMQEAVLANMLPAERAHIERAVATALDGDLSLRRPGAAGGIQSALHWAAADDPVAARPALVAGAEAAQQQYSFDLAHAFLEQVLATDARSPRESPGRGLGFRPPSAGDTGPGDEPTGLVLRTAEMAFLAGRPQRAVELATIALGGGVNASRRHLVMERLSAYQLASDDVASAIRTLEAAAAMAHDTAPADRARIEASWGRALVVASRYSEARATLTAAAELARSANDVADEARALKSLASVFARTGETKRAKSTLEQAQKLDLERGRSLVMPRPSRIGYVLAELVDHVLDVQRTGSPEEAEAAASAAARAADRYGRGAWGGLVSVAAADELFLLGRWAEEEELLSGDSGTGIEALGMLTARARLSVARGEDDRAMALTERGIAQATGRSPTIVAVLHRVQAELAQWHNRSEEARDASERALAALGDVEDETEIAEVIAIALRADGARAGLARVRRSSSELDAITEDATLLGVRAGVSLAAANAAASTGAASTPRLGALRLFCLAELQTTLGVPAADTWQAAATAFDALREPYSAAFARWRAAEALLGKRHDRTRADSLLREAHQAAETLGARHLIEEVESLARRARVDLGRRSTQPAPGLEEPLTAIQRSLGLSGREIEVLALIARGRSNRQIAEELFITEKTAGHHVSNILTKLTLSSRVEAAAVAHRVGLLAAMESDPSTT